VCPHDAQQQPEKSSAGEQQQQQQGRNEAMKAKDCRFWKHPNECRHDKDLEIIDHQVFLCNCPYPNAEACERYEKQEYRP
jgi:hypothetical protein